MAQSLFKSLFLNLPRRRLVAVSHSNTRSGYCAHCSISFLVIPASKAESIREGGGGGGGWLNISISSSSTCRRISFQGIKLSTHHPTSISSYNTSSGGDTIASSSCSDVDDAGGNGILNGNENQGRELLLLSDEQLMRQCEMGTFKTRGPGGQHRNKRESAVRLKHLPTGIIAQVISSS